MRHPSLSLCQPLRLQRLGHVTQPAEPRKPNARNVLRPGKTLDHLESSCFQCVLLLFHWHIKRLTGKTTFLSEVLRCCVPNPGPGNSSSIVRSSYCMPKFGFKNRLLAYNSRNLIHLKYAKTSDLNSKLWTRIDHSRLRLKLIITYDDAAL